MMTPKREVFVRALVSGKSQRQAYIEAYPNSAAWKPSSVDNQASALFRAPEVLARYKALKGEAEERSLWSAGKAESVLLSLQEAGLAAMRASAEAGRDLSKAAVDAIMSSVRELNTMHGIGQAKINVSGEIKKELSVSSLSDEELRRLAALGGESNGAKGRV